MGVMGYFISRGGAASRRKHVAVYNNKGMRMCAFTRNKRCLHCPSAPPEADTWALLLEQPSSNTCVFASASWGARCFQSSFSWNYFFFFFSFSNLGVKNFAAQNKLAEKI